MSTETTESRLRIIVALNACRRDLAALQVGANLAARKGCELQALFVEEMNLINVAELPFTKEIARISGKEREFDHSRITRAHRASLSQIQQAIDLLNEQGQLRASLKIVRGHFVRAVLSFIADIDVLVLSQRWEPPSAMCRPAKPVARAGIPQTTTPEKPIWAIFDGSEQSQRALSAAVDIAAAENYPLYVAVPAQNEGLPRDLRPQGSEAPASAVPSVRVVVVAPFDAKTLLRRIRQSGCGLLVVKRADAELLDEVAEAAECPVVLV